MTLWGRRSTRLDKRGLLVRTLVLFMFIALVGTACSDSDEPAAPEPAAPEPAAPEPAEPEPAEPEPAEPEPAEPEPAEPADEVMTGTIKLGLITSLSGDFVVYGDVIEGGTSLAVSEINDAGGFQVGDTVYTIDLVAVDTRSDTSATTAAATQLIRDEDVDYIIGPGIDFFTELVIPLTQPEKIIQLSSSTLLSGFLNPESTAPGGDYHYLFKTQSSFSVMMSLFAGGTAEFLPDATKSVIFMPDDDIGQLIGGDIIAGFEGIGHSVEVVGYPPGTTDFAPFLTRAKASEPDLVHFWYNPPDELAALREALELEVAGAYYVHSVDPAIFREEFPDGAPAPVLLSCVPLCFGEPSSDLVEDYWARYEAAGKELTAAAPVSLVYYDFVFMLIEAMKEAGTVSDTDAIVAVLEDLAYNGVLSQPLQFDDSHIISHGYDLCFVEAGAYDCRNLAP